MKIGLLVVNNNKDIVKIIKELSLNDKNVEVTLESFEKDKVIDLIDIIKSNTEVVVNYKEKELKAYITTILHELGLSSNIKGFKYTRESILMVYKRPGCIMKELYPEIAEKYNTTSSNVERNIRFAIESSWNKGNWELMEDIFGHSIDMDRAKPTNSEFIITIADRMIISGLR